jgi:hypothetical protein
MVRSKIASGIAFLLEFQKLQKFPAAKPGLEDIAVRLDAEPKP